MSERACQGCGADLTGTHGKRKWCSDKCRKETLYAGECELCGARTNGSNGPGKAAKLCAGCAPTANAKWSRERILDAMRQWRKQYRRGPGMLDWSPALAANKKVPNLEARKRRYQEGDWPCTNSVLNYFDTWNEAIEEAGLELSVGGAPSHWHDA